MHNLISEKRYATLIGNNFPIFSNFQDRFYVYVNSKINLNKVASIHV